MVKMKKGEISLRLGIVSPSYSKTPSYEKGMKSILLKIVKRLGDAEEL
jgi:hypothetical protein